MKIRKRRKVEVRNIFEADHKLSIVFTFALPLRKGRSFVHQHVMKNGSSSLFVGLMTSRAQRTVISPVIRQGFLFSRWQAHLFSQFD